jgi:chromosome segregation ATPase
MENTANRYARLCHAYIQLAERFQKLDVEHMTLKSKLVPLLKAMQAYKHSMEGLKQEKADLEVELQTLAEKYEELKPFEDLLQPETLTKLFEAEEQLLLVEQTIQEMESESDPDLNEPDKLLLDQYEHEPEIFLLAAANGSTETNGTHPTFHHSLNH